MKTVMSVSPDFSPEHIAGWYIFNTWLQRQLDMPIHLRLFDNFEHQREAIGRDEIDLIYANPYDASMLVREKGFRAVAAPVGKQDEALIATRADAPWQGVEDLPEGLRIGATIDPDVNMIGMIMLEPANLNRANTETVTASSYVLVAKHLLLGRADVGFFLKAAYDDLSGVIRRQLRPLVESHIYDVRHVLMAGPRLATQREQIAGVLLAMDADAKGRGVLASMGLGKWEPYGDEDTEFMIDLIDTLVD